MSTVYGTIYFLDASAILKLVLTEECSDQLCSFFEKASPFYTTSLCLGESLGVLKNRRFPKKKSNPQITQEAYIQATNYLLTFFKDNLIRFKEAPLMEPAIFFEAADLSDKYKIDLSDTLQIVTIRRSRIVGATLITADKDLAKAARKEGLTVWYCLRESPPQIP